MYSDFVDTIRFFSLSHTLSLALSLSFSGSLSLSLSLSLARSRLSRILCTRVCCACLPASELNYTRKICQYVFPKFVSRAYSFVKRKKKVKAVALIVSNSDAKTKSILSPCVCRRVAGQHLLHTGARREFGKQFNCRPLCPLPLSSPRFLLIFSATEVKKCGPPTSPYSQAHTHTHTPNRCIGLRLIYFVPTMSESLLGTRPHFPTHTHLHLSLIHI